MTEVSVSKGHWVQNKKLKAWSVFSSLPAVCLWLSPDTVEVSGGSSSSSRRCLAQPPPVLSLVLLSWLQATSHEASWTGVHRGMVYIKALRGKTTTTKSKKIKSVVFVTVLLHIVSAKASWQKATIVPIMVFTGFGFCRPILNIQSPAITRWVYSAGVGGWWGQWCVQSRIWVTCISSLHYNRATDQLVARVSPWYTHY